MYCRVLYWISTDVSEVRAASTIRVITPALEHGTEILPTLLLQMATFHQFSGRSV
jgi:hypothetical protein